ncbi:MAG: class I SAM-dependent methyltransferase, partial [Ilumatobacteraceae bacterium]
YWRVGPYLVESDADEQVERGVWIRFVHRPLSRYINALAEHGLFVERMLEPSPPESFQERAPGYAAAAAFPRLLYLRLTKSG